MDYLGVSLWAVAGIGWMGDWVTTVYPDEDYPEKNPFVVKHFGQFPSPIWFGMAKVASLAVMYLLSNLLNWFLVGTSILPASIFGYPIVYLVPLVIGGIGWHATLHNFYLLREE